MAPSANPPMPAAMAGPAESARAGATGARAAGAESQSRRKRRDSSAHHTLPRRASHLSARAAPASSLDATIGRSRRRIVNGPPSAASKLRDPRLAGSRLRRRLDRGGLLPRALAAARPERRRVIRLRRRGFGAERGGQRLGRGKLLGIQPGADFVALFGRVVVALVGGGGKPPGRIAADRG